MPVIRLSNSIQVFTIVCMRFIRQKIETDKYGTRKEMFCVMLWAEFLNI